MTTHPRSLVRAARRAAPGRLLRLWLALSLLLGSGGGAAELARDAGRTLGPAVARLSIPPTALRAAALLLAPIAALVASSAPVAAAEGVGEGITMAWGNNGLGELGDNTTSDRATPVAITGQGAVGYLGGATSLAGGTSFSLAVVDGVAWGWGHNTQGQLGDGTTTGSHSPVPVVTPSGTTVTAVAAGAYHGLQLLGNGTVRGWGWNVQGQVGDASQTDSPSPVQVQVQAPVGQHLASVVAIAARGNHSLAVKQDKTLWSWGANTLGEGGTGGITYGNTTARQVVGPTGVAFLTGVVATAAGQSHSLARTEDGTVYGWGSLQYGQVGDGVTQVAARTRPVAVLTGAKAIGAGGVHSLAVKADGTVWAWGRNNLGQLGDGSTTNAATPVQVSGLTDVVAVWGGGSHSLALTGGGALWAWGANPNGELGVTGSMDQCTAGNTPCRKTPIRVAAIGVVKMAAAGGAHSLGYGMPILGGPDGTWDSRVSYARPVGDPVQSRTGVYLYRKVDLAIPGRGPSPSLVRSYNSADTRVGPLGPGWTHNYNARLTDPGGGSGAVILVTPAGQSDLYAYNTDGTFTPPPSVTTALARNADGSYTAMLADRTTWTFSVGGRLTRVADRHGNASSLTYNGAGQLTGVSDPAGRGALALAYSSATSTGRLISVTDWQTPTARVVQYAYDGSGRLSTVTDRENQDTTYGYDASARLTTIEDANNHVALTNHYDAQGRVDWQKDAKGLATGQLTTFAYAVVGGIQTTTITHPRTSFEPTWTPGPQTIDTYDAQGRITQRVEKPASGVTDTTTYAYDASFFTTGVTDARGNTTSFCYDVDTAGAAVAGSRGNLTRTIAPPATTGGNPLVTLVTYDATNNVVQTVPPKGVGNGTTVTCTTNLSAAVDTAHATDLAYDAGGVLLLSTTARFTDPTLGARTAVTKYAYGDTNNPGLVTTITPPRGNTGGTPDATYATTLNYHVTGSQAGLLGSTVDPLGNTTLVAYDAVGRRTAMVDALGTAAGGVQADHTWTYAYDKEDRLQFATAPAPTAGGAPLVTEARYDAVGNKIVAIDANGQVTTYAYDERDSLAEVVQSPSAWTNPATTPSPRIVTAYAHDHVGNLTRVTRAQGDTTHERATDYAYDGANRLRTETQYPTWTAMTSPLLTQYTYDANGNRATVVDPLTRITTLGYDPLNRLTSVVYDDGVTPDVTYAHDANGGRTSMVTGTSTTTYALDELGRPTSVTSPGPVVVEYRYDLDGHRTKLIYPDTTEVTYAFNKAGQLASLSDWASRSTAYAYVPDGQLQTVTNPNGTTATHSYDNARRPTEVLNKLGTATISQHAYPTIDAVGNRVQVNETLAQVGGGTTTNNVTYGYDKLYRLTGDGTRSYTYEPVGNRLTSTQGGSTTTYAYDRADRVQSAGALGYTLDANGNTTARGSDTFAYDQANRLKTATVGGVATTYAYDGDGKRASSTVGGTTTTYAYDAARSLPVVLSDGTHKYVWGLGLAYAVDGAGAIGVGHVDGLGSVRALTDGAGALTQTYLTDPFGAVLSTGGASTQPFRFTGEQRDATGLYYLRARFYDPVLGRFLSRDPLPGSTGQPLSLNRYSYAHNNPVIFTDPSGLCAPPVTPICIGGAIVVGGALITAAAAIVVTAMVLIDSYSDTPSDRLDRLMRSHQEEAERTAERIAWGHAWEHHVQDGHWPNMKHQNDLAELLRNIVQNRKPLPLRDGRTGYWDNETGTLVIVNPNDADDGTAYQPDDGYDHVRRLRRETERQQ